MENIKDKKTFGIIFLACLCFFQSCDKKKQNDSIVVEKDKTELVESKTETGENTATTSLYNF